MPRLTLRTLLAYIDDTLEPTEARALGKKVAESAEARQLVERIKRITRRRGLATPVPTDSDDETADPNTVAEYLDNQLDSATLKQVEETCLESDVHLAEVAACHQILTLVLTEPVRVPPSANQRMYKMVKPPASDHARRPGKTLPVSGVLPPVSEHPEDEADAALLLGMKRYSAEGGWPARFLLIGVAAALLIFLVGAVLMALPQKQPDPPETSPGHSFAQVPGPQPPGFPPVVEPRPKDPNPSGVRVTHPELDPKVEKLPKVEVLSPNALVEAVAGQIAIATKATARKSGDPNLGKSLVPPPDPGYRQRAKVETSRVLVMTRHPDEKGKWRRVQPLELGDDTDWIISNHPVMALPGYKADVIVNNGLRDTPLLEVHLWGNVPEQLPYRVFESKVMFHIAPPEFDADITLLAGRIYLKSKKRDADKKPAEVKVRLRVGTEVWDITLPDEKTSVMVERISWFEPGTKYDRKGGSEPKVECRIAAILGNFNFDARGGLKQPVLITAEQQRTWDSVSGTLSNPKKIENMQEAKRHPDYLDKDVVEFQKKVTGTLTGMAEAVPDRDGVGSVVKNRLTPDPTSVNELPARLAIYSWAALADSTLAGSESLKELGDILNSELPWLGRQAVITAMVNWVAREKGNTALLHALLIKGGTITDNHAD
ncbi:MAG: hypothetical protein L0241_15580, partial [Planctomycetia bacterium]|nr:hypothetical protein [Planctomycetia bacterium]